MVIALFPNPVVGIEVLLTLANKTIGNAIAGVIGYAWPIALALITTPYIVSKLGNDAYGILALVTSVLGFFAFLDLGVTNAAVKYVAESYAKNDTKEISKIIGSSLSVFLTVGAMGGVLIAVMTSTLVQKLLKIPNEYVSDSTFAFYVASLGFALNMVGGVFGSIPKAIQRYDVATKTNMAIGTLLTLLIVLAVSIGYGLKQIVIINFLSSLVSVGAYIHIVKKNLPGISLKIQFDFPTFFKLFQFGIYALLVTISSSILHHLDRFLISYYLGPASVAFYVIPTSIVMAINSLVANLAGIVFPLCSHLYAKEEHDRLRALYLKASKYAFIVVISLVTPVVVLSTQIMTLWMGPEYGLRSSTVLAILAISVVFTSFTAVPSFILYGMGMPGMNAKFTILSAILNICLCLVLIPKLQLVGAALANLANFAIVILYFVTVDRRIIHAGLKHMVQEIWFKPLAAGIVQATVLYYILMPFVKGLPSLAVVIGVSLAIYYSASLLLNALNAEDKYLFKQYLHFKLKGSL